MTKIENLSWDFYPLEKKVPNVPRGTKVTIKKYLNLVFLWNQKINLTGAKSPEDFCLHHILDCYWASENFKRDKEEWLDVGSGSGLPGIVWGIFRPHWELFLVEGSRKKASFLNRVVSSLDLKNVRVIPYRAESLPSPWIKKFHQKPPRCVSRGTASPKFLLELIGKVKFPWKNWIAFSSEKTHQEFLTLGKKFAMRVKALHYPKDLGKESKQPGILTEIFPKK